MDPIESTRTHQIALFFFSQKNRGEHTPGPPSMASRLLCSHENTLCFIIKLAMIVTISYRTRLQLKWNSSDLCHVRGILCPPQPTCTTQTAQF